MSECPRSSDLRWYHPASRPQISSTHWWLSNFYLQLVLSSELQTPVSIFLTASVACLADPWDLTWPPGAPGTALSPDSLLCSQSCFLAKISFPFHMQRPKNLGVILDPSVVPSKSCQLCLQNIIKRCSLLPTWTAFKLPLFLAQIIEMTLNWSSLFAFAFLQSVLTQPA